MDSLEMDVVYYVCNLKNKKSQSFGKLPHSCISRIKLIIQSDGTVFMHRCKTHYGHQLELKNLDLSEERSKLKPEPKKSVT